jgi:hypothetical protein
LLNRRHLSSSEEAIEREAVLEQGKATHHLNLRWPRTSRRFTISKSEGLCPLLAAEGSLCARRLDLRMRENKWQAVRRIHGRAYNHIENVAAANGSPGVHRASRHRALKAKLAPSIKTIFALVDQEGARHTAPHVAIDAHCRLGLRGAGTKVAAKLQNVAED